jgi:uncharacterized protein (TIGR02646 family)
VIKLDKQDKPEILAQNETVWTQEYLQALDRGQVSETVRFRYRHPDIKDALKRETWEKCAYCESKITHAQPGDTEHIRPVSKHPHLIVAWVNLTLVCRVCNAAKGVYDSDEEPLVHPYNDDPEAHMRFLGPIVFHLPGDHLGYRTIKVLELNRPKLFERRKERLEQIQVFLDKWAMLSDGRTRDLIKGEIINYACCDKEFSALTRCFLRQHTGWSDVEIAACSPGA